MTRADVLVLGAGPAGSATAALAAASGADVVLVERARFPRDKVCGEFVSAEGRAVLGRLGLLGSLVEDGGVRIDACRVSDLSGRTLDAPLPVLAAAGGAALGISRSRMDAALLDLARTRGVRVREGFEAREPVIEAGRVAGMRCRRVGLRGAGEEIRATVVVGCDGRRSALGRALLPGTGDPSRSSSRSWFGIKTHLSIDPARLEGRVELHVFDGGYAGIAGVEGGRVNLCFLVTVAALRECGGAPERLFRERLMANPALAAVVGTAAPSGPWRSIGPLRFGVRTPSASGAMFVGDAAGTVDPFSGEGMSHALVGAEIAAGFVVRALERGGLDDALAADYATRWRGAFARSTRRNRWLGRLFERPRLARRVVGFLAGPGRPLVAGIVSATRTGARG